MLSTMSRLKRFCPPLSRNRGDIYVCPSVENISTLVIPGKNILCFFQVIPIKPVQIPGFHISIYANCGGVEVAGWIVDREIWVRSPAYPYCVRALLWHHVTSLFFNMYSLLFSLSRRRTGTCKYLLVQVIIIDRELFNLLTMQKKGLKDIFILTSTL